MEAELDWIARVAGAEAATRGESIQSLWSGYGEIFRVQLRGSTTPTVVVKWVKPPARRRGASSDASHARKCRSYDVETAWYRAFAPLCDDTCRVPALVGSRVGNDQWLFVLEDLDAAGFSLRRPRPSPPELDACLSWLAALHARFLGVAPNGLWKTGTYWHLATRADELAAIDDAELRDAAPIIDRKLRSAAFQTIVHGDAKLANFCFATRGRASSRVAAVDFQYAGGGCGMKDVAYLLSGACGSEAAEARHLDTYFAELRAAVVARAASFDVASLEAEWRALYPIACADFYRFLAGWAKSEWRSDAHGQALTRRVIRSL